MSESSLTGSIWLGVKELLICEFDEVNKYIYPIFTDDINLRNNV